MRSEEIFDLNMPNVRALGKGECYIEDNNIRTVALCFFLDY